MAQEIKSKVHKKCPKCEQWKSLSDYFADKTKADGRSSNCKACRVSANSSNEERKRKLAEYKKANREELNRKRRERRAAGNEKERLANERYRERLGHEGRIALSRKSAKKRKKLAGPMRHEIPKGKKFCRACGKVLKLEFFHEWKSGPSHSCVACTSEKQIQRLFQLAKKKPGGR